MDFRSELHPRDRLGKFEQGAEHPGLHTLRTPMGHRERVRDLQRRITALERMTKVSTGGRNKRQREYIQTLKRQLAAVPSPEAAGMASPGVSGWEPHDGTGGPPVGDMLDALRQGVRRAKAARPHGERIRALRRQLAKAKTRAERSRLLKAIDSAENDLLAAVGA